MPRATVLRVGGPETPLGRVRLAVISPQEPAMVERPFRVFPSYSLALVLGGRGLHRDERGVEREVEPGSILFVRPGVPHWYGPHGPTWAEAYVVFDGPLFDLLTRSVPALTRGLHGPVDTAAWLERLVRAIRSPAPPDLASATVELCEVAALLAELAGVDPGGDPDEPIAAAIRLLTDDVAARLSLQEVARRVGLGYEAFRHRFVSAAGVPPARYRDGRRVAAAAELLRATRLPQREIASMLGFADEYHFSKRFRQLTGTAPGAVRRGASSSSPETSPNADFSRNPAS